MAKMAQSGRISSLLYFVVLAFGIFFNTGCKDDKKSNSKSSLPAFDAPIFDANNAYKLIQDQLAFGHRVPGMESHKACKDFLVAHLKTTTDHVIEQPFTANFLTVQGAQAYNIIASYNPIATRRIMLAAHWDSRLIAEKDSDAAKRNLPILGADDGASGTAILLQLATLMKQKPLSSIGIDIVLFDAEDQGDSQGATESWCLGSQYWGQNPHVPNYFAEYGVLLDMVGAANAHFGYEEISSLNAKTQQKKVWALAHYLGYESLFTETNTQTIVDDHYYVMKYRGFPMVDIINRPIVSAEDGSSQTDFGHYHHTHQDDLSIISKETLAKVGHVITELVYREDSKKI